MTRFQESTISGVPEFIIILFLTLFVAMDGEGAESNVLGSPWRRHVIDASGEGADGARIADANGDGRPDVATAWEEGGQARLYLHPGVERVKSPWPKVTVGKVGSPEDAVLVDLDGDGAMDCVSSSEGKVKQVHVHWAPKDRSLQLSSEAWRTEPFPALAGKCRWMYALPMNVDGQNGVDLVIGGKEAGAELGCLHSPRDPRKLADWRWVPWRRIGWVMSLERVDMDGDGADDVLVSDRRGENRGCFWMKNPRSPAGSQSPWREQRISPPDAEYMFIDVTAPAKNRPRIAWAATRDKGLQSFWQAGDGWRRLSIDRNDLTGTPKAIRATDIDGDGRLDLVMTCENAVGKHGVVWFSFVNSLEDASWRMHDISGKRGIKFDRIELVDLDSDGDLDLLTTEEKVGLGVIWYENPTR